MLESELLPGEDVSTLLHELLTCLDTAGSEGIHSLANNPAVQRVLVATCRLQQLCWAQLPAGDQLFVFLVNLYNLMWLHALITLETIGESKARVPIFS